MATIACIMSSLGSARDLCTGCKEPIPRGSPMYAIVSEEGTPLGWWCDPCKTTWMATGRPPAAQDQSPAQETPS